MSGKKKSKKKNENNDKTLSKNKIEKQDNLFEKVGKLKIFLLLLYYY